MFTARESPEKKFKVIYLSPKFLQSFSKVSPKFLQVSPIFPQIFSNVFYTKYGIF